MNLTKTGHTAVKRGMSASFGGQQIFSSVITDFRGLRKASQRAHLSALVLNRCGFGQCLCSFVSIEKLLEMEHYRTVILILLDLNKRIFIATWYKMLWREITT